MHRSGCFHGSFAAALILTLGFVALAIAPPARAQCTSASCDDGNACTRDVCSQVTGTCLHLSISCDDGNACTAESCDPGIGCRLDSAIACDDHDPCTSEFCDPRLGLCTIVDGFCDGTGKLSIKQANVQGAMVFKRKPSGKDADTVYKVTFTQVLATLPGRPKLSLKTTIGGPDAQLASLVYPIVAMGKGNEALSFMNGSDLDFTVDHTTPPNCESLVPAETCAAVAQQLAASIDASLALGPAAERDGLRRAAEAFGYPPDVCPILF